MNLYINNDILFYGRYLFKVLSIITPWGDDITILFTIYNRSDLSNKIISFCVIFACCYDILLEEILGYLAVMFVCKMEHLNGH
jgi:hypothetical protein